MTFFYHRIKILCNFDVFLIKICDEKLVIILIRVKKIFKFFAMYFSNNIKFLRKRRSKTQDDVAMALGMKRSTLSGYENDVAEPNIEALLALSKYFNVAIDTLIKVDLSMIGEFQLGQLERGYDVHLKGSNIRVLATTVDSGNRENIELVSERAKAGYTTGYADPEYIRVLPTFQLPFLSKERKYRTFQISGDSMLPIPDKSYVTGEYVTDWHDIHDKQAYIILTIDDGIVFKIVENHIDNGFLTLHSLNPVYHPFSIHLNEIKEVWKFVHYISSEMPESANMPKEQQLIDTINDLRKQVEEIQLKLNI